MLILPKVRTQALAFGFGTMLAVWTLTAAADTQRITYKLNIPAESLDDALQAFAVASHHKLLYQTNLIKGKLRAPLQGEYTVDDALRKILAGTDLEYEITRDDVVIVRTKTSAP